VLIFGRITLTTVKSVTISIEFYTFLLQITRFI